LLVDNERDLAVGMGACVIRREWVGGAEKRIGYLTGLKLLPEYRRRVYCMPRVFATMRELTAPWVDIYYTTILKGNPAAQAMFERPHRGMPVYRFTGLYTVYGFRKRFCKPRLPTGIRLRQGKTPKLLDFLARTLPNFDLTPVFFHECTTFYYLANSQGEVCAACGIIDQHKEKQYVVSGYAGWYRLASQLPAWWLGYPRFPRAGVPARYLTAGLLRVQNNDCYLASLLLRLVAAQYSDCDFLLLGLHESSPFHKAFKRIPHIQYESKLYAVEWEGMERWVSENSIGLETWLL